MPVPAAAPSGFPGFAEDSPLDLPALDEFARSGLVDRLRDGSMDAFAETLAMVHNCARPVRLSGSSVTVDVATGEVLSSFSSSSAPLGPAAIAERTYARRAHAPMPGTLSP